MGEPPNDHRKCHVLETIRVFVWLVDDEGWSEAFQLPIGTIRWDRRDEKRPRPVRFHCRHYVGQRYPKDPPTKNPDAATPNLSSLYIFV